MNPSIPESAYSQLEYNPYCKGTVESNYPDLKPIFSKNDIVARYILALYQQDSPVHRDIKKWEDRQEYLFDEFGIKGTQKNNIKSHEDESVLEMIQSFLIHTSSEVWQEIVSYTYAFTEYQELIRKAIGKAELSEDKLLKAATTKTQLIKDSRYISGVLKSLKQELYGDDYELAEKMSKRRRVSPEGIAKRDV